MSMLHGGVQRLLFVALALQPALHATAAEPTSQSLTLRQSVEEALARSPSLRAKRATVAEAEGRLLAAGTIPFNPDLAVEAGRRTAPGQSDTDSSILLTQELEIGGQRGLRKRESSAELEAARFQLSREERILTADVRSSFALALKARELLAIERSNTALARSLADVARKRIDAGAATQMEVNLASAQVGRAERELHLAEGAYFEARSILAETIASDPALPPEPAGGIELPTMDPVAVSDRLSTALDRREDLQSFRSNTEAARLRIDRVRRERTPNLLVWGSYAREEGTDRIVGGGMGIGIPIFNRKQGPIAEARASHERATAETAALELQVRREVASTLARFDAAVKAAASLRAQVLDTLPENLDLLQRSFEAGKISWTEVLVFRREFVDVQREYVTTLTDAQLAAAELDLATSVSPAWLATEEHQP